MLRGVLAAGAFLLFFITPFLWFFVLTIPSVPRGWAVVFLGVLPGIFCGVLVLEFITLRSAALGRKWVPCLIMAMTILWILGQVGFIVSNAGRLTSVALAAAFLAALSLQIYIYGHIVRGFIGLDQNPDFAKDALSDARYGRALRTDIYRILGLPIAPNNFRLESRLALCLAVMAFLIEGNAFYTYIQASKWVRDIVAAKPGIRDQLSLYVDILGVGGTALAVVFGNLALAQVMLFGVRGLRRVMRLLLIQSIQEARKTDPRPPVLLLRAFRDDHVTMKRGAVPWHVRLFDPFLHARNMEDLLIQYFPEYGPFVAIGNPEDRSQPAGAARDYIPSEEWRSTVLQLMHESRWIILAVEKTDSILWELETIRNRNYTSKTLVVWPPQFTRDGDLHRRVLQLLNMDDKQLAPEVLSHAHLLAQWMGPFGEKAIVSSRVSEVEYEAVIRLALSDWNCWETKLQGIP